MALRSLTLSHFRSHKAFTLETDGRPVAFHGPNGAGKTNILEAISLLSPGRGLRRAAADEFARRPEGIGWRIRALLETGEGVHEIVTGGEPGRRRMLEIDGKSAPQSALGALASMLWLTPAMDRLWTEGAAERRRFLDRAALSFEPGHGDRAIAYEHAMRERNRLLAEGRGDPAWLAALEARMAKAGAGIARARVETVARLIAAQEGASRPAFPRAGLSISGPVEALLAESADPREAEAAAEALLTEELRAGRGRDAAAGRALFGPHRSDLLAIHVAKGVEAKLASTGEQKAILIAIILANARALAAERLAPTLLLDEIAAHLDAERRAALFDEIVAFGAPAFMTGAGAELFAPLGPRGLLIPVSGDES